MMINQLKQFVPSSVCLQCDGCCRVELADSPWRPKVGQQEIQDGVDQAGYVKTIPQGDRHQCVFFNKTDNTCGIYGQRPFECALYPFVLSNSSRGLEMYMHLACPYVQQHQLSQELQEHAAYLKEFFSRPETKAYLKNNNRLLHDYTSHNQELQFLFTVEV